MMTFFWIILIIGGIFGLVYAGAWAIKTFELGRPAQIGFGLMVLIVIVFAMIALVYMVNGKPFEVPTHLSQ